MTEPQKRRKEIQAGKTKYLHVSVYVKAPTLLTPALRTPIGQGATARKAAQPVLEPIGRRRRRARAKAREEGTDVPRI